MILLALGALAVSALDWRLLAILPVLSYLAGRRRELGLPALTGLGGVLVLGTAVQAVRGAEVYTWLVWIAGVIGCALFPALLGSFRRLRAALERSGWEQAAQLEREQQAVAEQARLRERARIAQDMHDSLGHELSLIALRAGAFELAAGLTPEQRAAASGLRAGVTDAAERLSDIVGLLRDESDEVPLRPADERIEDLITRAAASGIPVSLHVDGPGSPSAPDVPGNAGSPHFADVAPVQYRAAYRVVQEALTNATKHAAGASVRVRLGRDGDEIAVTVRNTAGSAAPTVTALPHGGRGLTGLRERVGLAGGALRAGPLPDGGFEVAARLPVRSGPVVPPFDAEPAGFRRARRRARRGLMLALAVPTALIIVLVGALMAVYAQDSLSSHLPPDRFRAMQVGAHRDDVAGLLPARQVPERRDEAGPTPPAGSTCEYYRSAAGFLPAPFDVYRLCFRDGRLVAKDAFPAG
ncbi:MULTISPECIES: sensor histidine kinase [Catenuloplanes]|uniref:histidine kinase n=1 Tax=Catenuloplanes niger TaxID=587534 RepID=A0AAE3ZZU2_9ACTN|nr:histidine kinase [Catenuloplanes niger]MDR7328025.1 signal transduction histidine kinase [Catenuloplanes niger]